MKVISREDINIAKKICLNLLVLIKLNPWDIAVPKVEGTPN